jgi:hypothetical protein
MGWLTPLLAHISGGRRGQRWRVTPPRDSWRETIAYEVGDKAEQAMEREWFHGEDALDAVFYQRRWRVEALITKLARERAAEAREHARAEHRPAAIQAMPLVWVATKMGKCRHLVTQQLLMGRQFVYTVCGQGWTVHECSPTEMGRLFPCVYCTTVIEDGTREDFLMKEAGR